MFHEGLPPHLLPDQGKTPESKSLKQILEDTTHLRGNTEALFFSLPHRVRSNVQQLDLPTMRTVVRGYARLTLACESRQQRSSEDRVAQTTPEKI